VSGSVARPAARSLAQAALLGAAVNLFEHVRHHAKKGDDKAAESEEQADGLPKRCVRWKTGLITVADESHAAGYEREEQESSGKDVEISGH